MSTHNGMGAPAPARLATGRWLYVLIPVAILTLLIGWRLAQHHEASNATAKMQLARKNALPVVRVATATVRDITNTFDAFGSVEAPDSVQISSKVTGRILAIAVQQGDPVTRSQFLVQIDPSQVQAQVQQQQQAVNSAMANYNQTRENYSAEVAAAMAAVTSARDKATAANAQIQNAQAAVLNAQANVNNARAQNNRSQTLFSEGAIAAQNADIARTALQVAEGQLAIAKAQLNSNRAAAQSALADLRSAENQAEIARNKGKTDIQAASGQVGQAKALLANAESQYADTQLHSPVKGFVSMRSLNPGDTVSPGQMILTLQYIQQVWVTVSIPVELSSSISEGQQAAVTIDGLPGRSFDGHVTQVTESADPSTRQFPVRITLNNPGNIIKPGMYAHVSFVTQRTPNAIVVPLEAVRTVKGAQTVSVVGPDNVVHVRQVTTGARDPNGIAILSGVKPGEKVVTLSQSPPRNGQKVRIGSTNGSAARGRSRGRAGTGAGAGAAGVRVTAGTASRAGGGPRGS